MLRKLARDGHRWAENRTAGHGGKRREVGRWQGPSEKVCPWRKGEQRRGAGQRRAHLGLGRERDKRVLIWSKARSWQERCSWEKSQNWLSEATDPASEPGVGKGLGSQRTRETEASVRICGQMGLDLCVRAGQRKSEQKWSLRGEVEKADQRGQMRTEGSYWVVRR